MNVLILGVGGNRQQAAISDAEYLLEHGAEVTLIRTQQQKWRELDPQIRIIDISDAELRHPVRYIEWVLVFRLARIIFKVLRKAFRGPLSRPVDGLEKGYEKVAWKFHRGIFERGYKHFRPLILWQVTRHRVLPKIDVQKLDLVLVLDPASIPIGWHLAKRHRDLNVTFFLDRSSFLREQAGASLPVG